MRLLACSKVAPVAWTGQDVGAAVGVRTAVAPPSVAASTAPAWVTPGGGAGTAESAATGVTR